MANLDQYGVEHLISKIKSVIVTSEITYSKLKELRDSGTLIPGQQYRITDYVTTTASSDTLSAGHQFDIIVTALDNSTLCEEAHAIQTQGDIYFKDCDLAAWKIWYCLDNDTNRFSWADGTNGKGVIYRMIDEWGNDCPYDFKNIMFKKWLCAGGSGITTKGDDADYDEYCYTFSWQDAEYGGIMDASVVGNNGHVTAEYGANKGVYGNVIGVWIDGEYGYPCQQLNSIVFLSTYMSDYGGYNGCYSNTFGENCYNNIFNSECHSNTFGNGCCDNTFGDGCYYNTFGDGCFDNTFELECSYNTFGYGCHYNTFGYACYDNTFGNHCYSNTFGNECRYNKFGNNCYSNIISYKFESNTFGNSCDYNTFGYECKYNNLGNYCGANILGNYCVSNTFGNDCYGNKFGNASRTESYYRYIIFDNGNQYIYLYSNVSKGSSKYYQNVRIGLGVNNTTYKTITDRNVGQAYETLYRPTNSKTNNI